METGVTLFLEDNFQRGREGNTMLNSVLNEDWSNSVIGRQFPKGHRWVTELLILEIWVFFPGLQLSPFLGQWPSNGVSCRSELLIWVTDLQEIAAGLNYSVTHLRSYTNTAIAGNSAWTPTSPYRAPTSPEVISSDCMVQLYYNSNIWRVETATRVETTIRVETDIISQWCSSQHQFSVLKIVSTFQAVSNCSNCYYVRSAATLSSNDCYLFDKQSWWSIQ